MFTRDGKLYTEKKDKADILNCQLQSVFTPKTPLALSSLAQIAVQDLVDTGKLDTRSVSAKNINNQPVMSDIKVSENGILELLKDLNPYKAAGPDELKPLVLRELREVKAPMLVIIFQRSVETGRVPKKTGMTQMCALCSRKVIKAYPQITGPYRLHAYCVKS